MNQETMEILDGLFPVTVEEDCMYVINKIIERIQETYMSEIKELLKLYNDGKYFNNVNNNNNDSLNFLPDGDEVLDSFDIHSFNSLPDRDEILDNWIQNFEEELVNIFVNKYKNSTNTTQKRLLFRGIMIKNGKHVKYVVDGTVVTRKRITSLCGKGSNIKNNVCSNKKDGMQNLVAFT